MGFQEDLNEIKRVIANSKLRDELPPGTPENGDLVGFFNSVLNREERIEWSDFVGLAGSAGVTFDQTGDFWNVKVNGSTVFQVSKAGQTGQYADILNAPPLGDYQLKSEKGLANGYTPNDSNNKVPIVHIPDLPYVPTGGYSGTGQDLQDQIDGLDQAIILQNTPFDASTGVFPGDGTAQAGYKYLVSIGGTVDGVTFANGDSITAIIDNASTTTYAGNWQKINNAESVQNFQQVTDQGGTTTNEVESTSSFKAPQFKISNSGFEAILSAVLTASRNISFQDKDGTVALLSDLVNFARTDIEETFNNQLNHIYPESNPSDLTRPVIFNINYDVNPNNAPVSLTDFHGIDINMSLEEGNNNSNSNVYAFESQARNNASQNVGRLVAILALSENNNQGQVDQLTGLQMINRTQNTGNALLSRNIWIKDTESNGTGTITDAYGIYIDEFNNATGANYGIYSLSHNFMKTLELSSSSFPVLECTRETTSSVGIASALNIDAKTSVNMASGFGTGLIFSIEDDAGVKNLISRISARRGGADNSGYLEFYTGVDGNTLAVTINEDSSVNFTNKITTVNPSGYTTPLTLASLGDNDWITKKQFNDNGAIPSEGTFTPSLTTNTGVGTYGYSSRSGYYYKIGKMVVFTLTMVINSTSVSPTGYYQISGLPFNSKASTYFGMDSIQTFGLNTFYSITGSMTGGNGIIALRRQTSLDDSNNDTITAQSLTSASIQVSGTYITD